MRTFSTAELQRAGAALVEGRFRSSDQLPETDAPMEHVSLWNPAEAVVVVAGVTGRVGTTTIALAAASGIDDARLVEASPLQASGLSIASTAELDVDSHGWRSANRDELLIERRAVDDHDPARVPPPPLSGRTATVVDVGWSLNTQPSMNDACWLGQALGRFPLVLVTCATAPGMRALEAAVARSGRDDVTVIVTGQARARRWSKATKQALRGCPRATALAAAGRLHPVALSRSLVDGITEARLPTALLEAVAIPIAPLLSQKGTHHVDPL